MEFTIALGLGGWLALIVGAIVIGVVAQYIGDAHFGYEWVLTAIGAFIGGLVLSEFFVDLRSFEPVWDGLALIPAAIGGVVLGGVVAGVTRYLTRETFTTAA